jgi:hypothetical protein
LSIDIADWYGVPLRRVLLSAGRFSEFAMCSALSDLKTEDIPGQRRRPL